MTETMWMAVFVAGWMACGMLAFGLMTAFENTLVYLIADRGPRIWANVLICGVLPPVALFLGLLIWLTGSVRPRPVLSFHPLTQAEAQAIVEAEQEQFRQSLRQRPAGRS